MATLVSRPRAAHGDQDPRINNKCLHCHHTSLNGPLWGSLAPRYRPVTHTEVWGGVVVDQCARVVSTTSLPSARTQAWEACTNDTKLYHHRAVHRGGFRRLCDPVCVGQPSVTPTDLGVEDGCGVAGPLGMDGA